MVGSLFDVRMLVKTFCNEASEEPRLENVCLRGWSAQVPSRLFLRTVKEVEVLYRR